MQLEVVPYGCIEWLRQVHDSGATEPPIAVSTGSGHLHVLNTTLAGRWTVRGDIAIELPYAPGHWRRGIVAERDVLPL